MTKFRFPQAFVESVLTRRQQDVQHAMDIANKYPATHAMCDAAVNGNRARLAALQQARPQGNGRSPNSIFYVDPKDARLQAQATEMKAQATEMQAMRATINRQDKELKAKDNTILRQEAELKAMDERNTRQQTENGELLKRLMDMQEAYNNAMTMSGSQGTLNTPVCGNNGPITTDNFINGSLGGACKYIPAGHYSIEGSSSRRGSSCSSDGGSSRRSSSQGSCSSDGSSSGRMSWGSIGGSSGKAHSLFVRRLSSSTGGGASCPSLSPQRSVVAVTGPSPFTALILATAVPVSSSSDNSPTFGKLPTASQPAALALPSNLKEPVNFDVFTAQLKAAQEALAARRITSSSSSSSSSGGSSSSSSEAGSGDIRSSSSSRGSVEADQGAKEGAPKAFSSKVAGVSNSSSSSRKGHFSKAARGKQAAAANTTRRAAAKKAAAALV